MTPDTMCSQRSSSGKWKPAPDPAQMVSQMLMMAASKKPVVMAPFTVLSGCMKRLLYFSMVSVLQKAMPDRVDGRFLSAGQRSYSKYAGRSQPPKYNTLQG